MAFRLMGSAHKTNATTPVKVTAPTGVPAQPAQANGVFGPLPMPTGNPAHEVIGNRPGDRSWTIGSRFVGLVAWLSDRPPGSMECHRTRLETILQRLADAEGAYLSDAFLKALIWNETERDLIPDREGYESWPGIEDGVTRDEIVLEKTWPRAAVWRNSSGLSHLREPRLIEMLVARWEEIRETFGDRWLATFDTAILEAAAKHGQGVTARRAAIALGDKGEAILKRRAAT